MQQVNTELYHKNVIELEVTVPITVDGEITAEGESKIRSIFDDVYQKVETINQAPIGTNGESVGGPSTRPNIRNKSPRSQAITNLKADEFKKEIHMPVASLSFSDLLPGILLDSVNKTRVTKRCLEAEVWQRSSDIVSLGLLKSRSITMV